MKNPSPQIRILVAAYFFEKGKLGTTRGMYLHLQPNVYCTRPHKKSKYDVCKV